MKYIFYLSLFLGGLAGLWSCNEDVYVDAVQLSSIRGRVLYSVNQQPISNAQVRLTPSNRIIYSDSLGNFRFDSVLVGRYTVQVSKDRYSTEFVTVETNITTSPLITVLLSDATRQNTAPTSPTLVTPAVGSVVEPVNLVLKWNATDPNRDTLRYDVVLYRNGSVTPTSSYTGLTADSVVVNLDYNSSYLWQVTARDGFNAGVPGPIWSFRTNTFPEYNYVFARMVGNQYQIFGATADGRLAQFTRNGSNWRPVASPNRQQIAYISNVDTELQLYVMNADGSNMRRVTTVPIAGINPSELSFCWSPDGSQLLYPNNDRLYAVRVDGTGLRVAVQAFAGRIFASCDWTSQNNLIAARTTGTNGYNNEIVTYSADGTNGNLLYSRRNAKVGNPVFSLNGRQLLFSADSSSFVNEQNRQLDARLYLLDIVTKRLNELGQTTTGQGQATQNTKPAGTNDLDPRFSPTGAQIIFTNTDNTGLGVKSLYRADLNGANRVLIVSPGEMGYWRQ